MDKKASVISLKTSINTEKKRYSLIFTIMIDGIEITFSKPLILDFGQRLDEIITPFGTKTLNEFLEKQRIFFESHINKNKFINANSLLIEEIVQNISRFINDLTITLMISGFNNN